MAIVTVNVNPATGGQTWGAGSYAPGSSIKLVAVPATNHRFVRWSDGMTVNPRDFTVPAVDTTVTAEFVQVANVTIVAGPHGSVRPAFAGTADVGTTVSVTTTADAGFTFSEWSDHSRVANRDFTVTAGGLTMVAYFEAVTPVHVSTPWEQFKTWVAGIGWWKLAIGAVLITALIIGRFKFGGKIMLFSGTPAGGPSPAAEVAKGDKQPKVSATPDAAKGDDKPVQPEPKVPTTPVSPTTIVVQAPPAPPAPNVNVTTPVSVTAVINLPPSPPPAPPVGGLQPPATPPPPPPVVATTTPVTPTSPASATPPPHRRRPVVNNFNPVIDVIVE